MLTSRSAACSVGHRLTQPAINLQPRYNIAPATTIVYPSHASTLFGNIGLMPGHS
jgi:hypothetical protein